MRMESRLSPDAIGIKPVLVNLLDGDAEASR